MQKKSMSVSFFLAISGVGLFVRLATSKKKKKKNPNLRRRRKRFSLSLSFFFFIVHLPQRLSYTFDRIN